MENKPVCEVICIQPFIPLVYTREELLALCKKNISKGDKYCKKCEFDINHPENIAVNVEIDPKCRFPKMTVDNLEELIEICIGHRNRDTVPMQCEDCLIGDYAELGTLKRLPRDMIVRSGKKEEVIDDADDLEETIQSDEKIEESCDEKEQIEEESDETIEAGILDEVYEKINLQNEEQTSDELIESKKTESRHVSITLNFPLDLNQKSKKKFVSEVLYELADKLLELADKMDQKDV